MLLRQAGGDGTGGAAAQAVTAVIIPAGGAGVLAAGAILDAALSAEISSLVGRGPQIAAVLDGLRTGRVVTLSGPGGCGKTRLTGAGSRTPAAAEGRARVTIQHARKQQAMGI